jgi:hypothetical protein
MRVSARWGYLSSEPGGIHRTSVSTPERARVGETPLQTLPYAAVVVPLPVVAQAVDDYRRLHALALKRPSLMIRAGVRQ